MFIKYDNVTAGGFDTPLLVENLNAPSHELRENISDAPNRHGSLVGRTWLGNTTWQLDLVTNRGDLPGAAEEARKFQQAWQKASTLQSSNTIYPLSYSYDEKTWRRCYGTPSKFTGFAPDVLSKLGVARITADFIQTRPEYFSDTEKTSTITYMPPVQGGLMTPLMTPLTTTGSGEERAGFVTNQGDLATPLKVIFHGPIVNPVLRSATGWEVGFRGSIAAGNYVTIDPLQGTVKNKAGTTMAGLLTTKTRLSQVTAPVGSSEYFLKGSDGTMTAKVEIKFRDAYRAAW